MEDDTLVAETRDQLEALDMDEDSVAETINGMREQGMFEAPEVY